MAGPALAGHPTRGIPWPGGALADFDRYSLRRSRPEAFRIGLLVPLSGPAGLWGPAAQACAFLAAAELNRADGIGGREVELISVDAGRSPEAVATDTADLLENEALDAIVGMHDSGVRGAVARAAENRVPYVYTPLYEGGERSPGVYAIGDTPDRQLRPAIAHVVAAQDLRRWCFLGNDYVWPRRSHRLAATYVREAGGQVTDDIYVPFGYRDPDDLLERILRGRPDALLLSLVGEDTVRFNRAFGAAGLDRQVLRLSAIIDEHALFGIGAANTRRLFVASSYFGALSTADNRAFKERYLQAYDGEAPALSAMGQSVYEGFQFLAALAEGTGERPAKPRPPDLSGPRGALFGEAAPRHQPMYLAEADGHEFQVISRFRQS